MLLMKQNNTSKECNCIQVKESILISEKSYKIRIGKVFIEKKSLSPQTCIWILRAMGGSLLITNLNVNKMFKLGEQCEISEISFHNNLCQ